MIRPIILMALGLSKYIEVLEVPYYSPISLMASSLSNDNTYFVPTFTTVTTHHRGGSAPRHVGHSIFMSIQRSKHSWWKKWLHGVTIRRRGSRASTAFMQMTQSTPPASPHSSSPPPALASTSS